MTPTQKAAMEQALEALKGYEHVHGAYSNAEAAITMLQAALAETAEPVAGWKLVPANLTQDMADSAKVVDGRLSVWKYADVYRAMLNAAPQPPAPAVRYDGLYEYAAANRLSYNELCRVVHAAIAAHEAKKQKGQS